MTGSTGPTRLLARSHATRGAVVMSAVWLATVIGALAIVRVLVELVSTMGADGGLLVILSMLAVVAIAYVSIGVLIHHQRPGNRIAWVLAAGGSLIVLTFAGFSVGAIRYGQFGAEDQVGGWFALVGATALGPALYIAVPLVAILFPDGRVPGKRWRLPVVAATGLIAASSLIGLTQPGPVDAELADNPLGVGSAAIASLRDLGLALLPVGLLAGAILAVGSVAARFRRGGTTERAQLKWLLTAVAVCAVLLPPSFVDENGESGFSLLDALAMASLALVPLSVGVAVTRYHLYEIDRFIGRTVAYAILTAVLAGTFVATNLALQAALADRTGSSTLITAAATLVVAALFQPLRRRVQRVVDRRFDRGHVDAAKVVSAFGVRARDEVDLVRLNDAVVTAAGEAVAPASASLWLRVVR